ncbi:MAG TPA: carboxypeptidase regulatory-like domain-containing protein [Vicinamibacterales bacterium]|nr:carboxypeptidase regulatory-like domain-containing protein [Vicinamibacterales bacterium]
MKRPHCLLLVGVLLLCTAGPALAQRSTASLRGTITDATQSILPGVTVTVTNVETGLVRTTVSNESGVYFVPELPVGRYTVAAELAGFKAASRTNVLLRVADEFAVDFLLQPGDVKEVVTVEASSTPVRLVGGDVSGVVTGEMVRELPLNGRNFLQLATLMPGVSAPDFLNVKDKGLLGGSDLSVSGSDVTANMWTVDGANNNDVGSNRTLLVYPSLEAIEEFKILRNSYGPEFGGAGGAQINIVTRAGTNQFRGSLFYSGRDDSLNARNYFLEQADQPKEELTRRDFGGSIGGPLMKDKLHFFGNVEWNLEKRGTARAAFVPTEAERNGDFSGARIPGCSPPIPTDPLTGQPFPGNRIPADRLSPGGQAFLSLYPLPNVTPGAGSCNNWVTSITSPIDFAQQSGRVDWTITDASRLMVRYTHDKWENNAPSINANLWGDDPFPAVDSNWDQPSQSFVAALNQTLGNTANNSLQFSYSANKIDITRGGLNADLNAEILNRIQPLFGYDRKQYGEDIGHPVFWGGAGYQALWNEAPFLNSQDLFIVKDDYTQVFGKHFVKAGVLASVNKKTEDTIGNGSNQHSAFWGSAGFNGWGATTGNILSDFLLRDMTFGFSEFTAGRNADQRWKDVELYVADSWQPSKQFTVDFGVRYSVFMNPYAADDRVTNFVPSLFDPALGNDPCNGVLQPPGSNWCQDAGALGGADAPNRSLMEQDYNNIAPRLGIAWNVFGDSSTAIRAGLGRFFLRERLTPLLSLAVNPPFVTTLAGIRKLDTTAEPCDGCFGSSLGAPTRGRETDFRTPNSWQWNVMLQRELWRNATIDIGYVANHGYDLLKIHVANQVLNGDVNANGVDDRLEFIQQAAGSTDPSLRRFGVFNTNIGVWDHTGKSTYHSLQTQFVSRFGRGSQVQASYTLSRSRANLALTDSGQLAANTTQLDIQDPELDWGRPETGRTHIFNASLVWLLPAMENRSALARHLLGDWEIASILGAGSGQPFTAFAGTLSGMNGGPSGTGFNDNQRPNRVAGEECRASSGPAEQIINPNAYTLDGFQLGTIGSARRGDCTGPGYFQTDLALYKNFRVNERMKVQFRWDIFNIFNNKNFLFAGMNATMTPSAFTLNDARTEIVDATIPASFGQATRTRDPRQMQFGFKILW